mgnify:CR=1 FL=1
MNTSIQSYIANLKKFSTLIADLFSMLNYLTHNAYGPPGKNSLSN